MVKITDTSKALARVRDMSKTFVRVNIKKVTVPEKLHDWVVIAKTAHMNDRARYKCTKCNEDVVAKQEPDKKGCAK
jgi:transposase-like protein